MDAYKKWREEEQKRRSNFKDTVRYEKVTREVYCRVCNIEFERNTKKLVRFYSTAGKGQHVFLCKECVKSMAELIKE